MKKSTLIIASLIVTGTALCVLSQSASAASNLSISSKMIAVGTAAGYGSTSLTVTVGRIIRSFLSLLGILFMAYTLYAGYLWLTAAGSDEKISHSKAILRGSIIGLIIVMSAYAITFFVVSKTSSATGYNAGDTQAGQ